MGATGVMVSTAPSHGARPGSIPRVALHDLRVAPVPLWVAKPLVVANHYLHSLPGGTHMAFGVFLGARLLGALTLGVGPKNGHRLVEGAVPNDVITLSRLWLDDLLPPNSESRVIAIVLRSLRKHTSFRFALAYADPSAGHVGTVYRASGWLYTGLSEPMPMYDVGDGVLRHSRSFAHAQGTHSLRYFRKLGIDVRVVAQRPKYRYLYPLDPAVREMLTVPILPYPKPEVPA